MLPQAVPERTSRMPGRPSCTLLGPPDPASRRRAAALDRGSRLALLGLELHTRVEVRAYGIAEARESWFREVAAPYAEHGPGRVVQFDPAAAGDEDGDGAEDLALLVCTGTGRTGPSTIVSFTVLSGADGRELRTARAESLVGPLWTSRRFIAIPRRPELLRLEDRERGRHRRRRRRRSARAGGQLVGRARPGPLRPHGRDHARARRAARRQHRLARRRRRRRPRR
jgi:hypothetical protein